jgi:hypothetical protein
VVVEIAVPDDWTPGQTLAVCQLIQHAVRTAVPVVAMVRKDVTADQLQEIYAGVNTLIREAGLQAE